MSGGENARRIGRWGEALAAEYLRGQGYHLLATDYRCRMGEIDLIARREDMLVFVEVKTRRHVRFGQGREAVDRRKQAHIISAARQWMLERPDETLQPRFDVVEILAPAGTDTTAPEITHLENAFGVEEWSEDYTSY